MGSKSPRTPDPYKVSAADAQGKKDTAAYQASLDRVNQSSPFGSISYTTDGVDPATGAPRYSQQTSLSPQFQSLLDSQTASQQGISDAIGGAIGRLPSEAFNPNIDVGDIQKNSFDSQMAQLQPQFDQGYTQMLGTLNDRGLPLGSEIETQMSGNYNRAKDSSILGASRQANLDATNEAQRQYGNQYQQYMMPYQQLSSLMGNSQGVSNPQFSSVPQVGVGTTDVSGNVWNAYKADSAAAQQGQNQLFGGLMGLGSLAMNPASAFGMKLWG